MSKRTKKKHRPKQLPQDSPAEGVPGERHASPDLYEQAHQFAEAGDFAQARRLYGELLQGPLEARMRALARSDLAVLAALDGDLAAAREGFRAALELDAQCEPACANLALVEAEAVPEPEEPTSKAEPKEAAVPSGPADKVATARPVKVALLSFLFNWPSTGGGIVHTVELARFLQQAGYAVKHLYARFVPWEVGRVEGSLPFDSEALDFDEAAWNVPAIQARYREAVDAFAPDHVILTDSWNMKPLLAEAVRGYPYLLRLQAMECLCPLNNVRLLPGEGDRFKQCRLHQLATPDACGRCVRERGQFSGGLHRLERALCGVGTPEYHAKLLQAVRKAEAVLVVNPLTEALVRPYVRSVRVVTAGMDPTRFPPPEYRPRKSGREVKTLLFAGLVQEPMKGFHVLQQACALLWARRQDFEVVATADPPGPVNEFTRFVGWLSQDELPRHLREADVLVLPTVAQEALGRTAVEAMAAGRPVVASCLGGLPFTVQDGVTGLLCRPDDPLDLACKLAVLLEDVELRERLGRAGRHSFEEHYAWPAIIERHYRPLLVPRPGESAAGTAEAPGGRAAGT
jgi:glycosyltransferase involved in cell wall biosynthesis